MKASGKPMKGKKPDMSMKTGKRGGNLKMKIAKRCDKKKY